MGSGIGEALRAARRAQGRTLADAANATRVRETYLAALEQEDFAALGDDVYARGFLRSYARYLGLDPEPLLDAYRHGTVARERRGQPPPGRRQPPVADTRSSPPRERPPGTAILLVLIVVILVVLAVVGLGGGGVDGSAQGVVAVSVRIVR
jgi:cytoskeletal protein RodZ